MLLVDKSQGSSLIRGHPHLPLHILPQALGANRLPDNEQLFLQLFQIMRDEPSGAYTICNHLPAVLAAAGQLGQIYCLPDSVAGVVAAQQAVRHHAYAVQEIHAQVDQQSQIGRRGQGRGIKSGIGNYLLSQACHCPHQVSGIGQGGGIAQGIDIGLLRLMDAERMDQQALGAICVQGGKIQCRLGPQGSGNIGRKYELFLA